MDDILLLQMLRKKGIITDRDMHEFHELTSSHTLEVQPIYLNRLNKISEEEAKEMVYNMYHIENGRKYIGEKYDIAKAKEVCEKYRGLVDETIDYIDIYLAINSHYHDFIVLYKTWFTDHIDCKIIESAITFWFKDSDFKYEDKIAKMFTHK